MRNPQRQRHSAKITQKRARQREARFCYFYAHKIYAHRVKNRFGAAHHNRNKLPEKRIRPVPFE